MNKYRRIISLIFLHAFLASGGFCATRALCVEADGDVFFVNSFMGEDEATNDWAENDGPQIDWQSLDSANDSKEPYILINLSEGFQTAQRYHVSARKFFLMPSAALPANDYLHCASPQSLSVANSSRKQNHGTSRVEIIRTVVLHC